MKAVICSLNDNVEIYTPGIKSWRHCPCGRSAATWDNPLRGDVAVAVDHPTGRAKIRVLGLNNYLLGPILEVHGQVWEQFREWHREATDAPGYVFDTKSAGCWAVPVIVGTTTDTRWATDEELAFVFRKG